MRTRPDIKLLETISGKEKAKGKASNSLVWKVVKRKLSLLFEELLIAVFAAALFVLLVLPFFKLFFRSVGS